MPVVTRFTVVFRCFLALASGALLGCTRSASSNGADAAPSKALASAVASPEPSASTGVPAAPSAAPGANRSEPGTKVSEPAAPRTEEECRACNGAWGKHGLRQIAYCNCGTKDGDKRCRDGAECEGLCVAADEPEREIVQAGPPPRGYFVGKCSAYAKVFGCNRIIPRGAAAGLPHDFTVPLQKMCFD